MKAQFFGTCVSNPFSSVEELDVVVCRSIEITQRTFFKRCQLSNDERVEQMQYPHYFGYHRSKYRGRFIYYYTWSRIEHFYG